jgi:hypothetical protein
VRRADQVGGALLLLLAVAYSAGALRYVYRAPTGPGPGFLPFWLGIVMAGLGLVLLVRASRVGEPAGAAWLPRGRGLGRLVTVVAAVVAFVALLPVVGMILGVACFLVGILRFLEGYSWRATLGVTAGAAVLTYAVFTYWLQVPFPVGVLGF